MFNERVSVVLSVPVFFQVVGYAARNDLGTLRVRIGYAARFSRGALRAEIWENHYKNQRKSRLRRSPISRRLIYL